MRRLRNFHQDEKKLKQLILYVSQKSAHQPSFGSTKLNKILYFADFLVYINTGNPLTGVEYQRLRYGPAPRRMIPILNDLKKSRQMAMQQILLDGVYACNKPVNLVPPDISLFSSTEISIVDDVIENFDKWTASDTSQVSHDWGGWKYAKDRDIIPYESAFVSNEEITLSDKDSGLKIAKQYGLLDG